MTRVLVVDDDRQLARALRIALSARGYEVAVATDGASGLAAAERTPPDLVIVDLGLPDMDGVSIVQALRGWSAAPIIVLSARHAEQSKINALDAGADDYVTKPFAMGELLARIRAALRRATAGEQISPVVTTAAFTVNLSAKRVTTTAGAEVRLTPTEWHLLEVLARNPDRLVTHQQLLHEVWGPRYETETNYLRVHLANLRRKLEPDPSRPRYLRTDPGLGYRFTPEQ
ncbi:two-component system, OmpR family, KDP operon response regulator KdpE [Micromonospora rhizosphaerae]|uniref:Two-component system, OmpR family, KDP operon response regulator KdpE n=1 Tax=Micromonospora rhizosphaerae TaxID=568872 RepID=A0A1C6T2P7_9ACTN|nr:response regulator [Micromonospora rhizosphaerae]SCL35833.1 two-component system, OmpR family, KDP operon response regulator KdpE [Micromonospora rhizosphaerae]